MMVWGRILDYPFNPLNPLTKTKAKKSTQMRTTGLSSLPLLLVLMLRLEVAAQDLSNVAPGDLIRVAILKDPHHKKTGICDSLHSDAIYMTLENSGKHGRVPLATIASLEVCVGTKQKAWAGAGVGLLIGTLAGGVIGAVVASASNDPYAGLAIPAGLIIGAPSGFLVGAVAGSLIKSKQWVEVPLTTGRRGKK